MKTIVPSAFIMILVTALPLAQTSGQGAAGATQSADMAFHSPTNIEWKSGPASLPAGAKMAALEGDPTKDGPFVMRLQLPNHYQIPAHTHPKRNESR